MLRFLEHLNKEKKSIIFDLIFDLFFDQCTKGPPKVNIQIFLTVQALSQQIQSFILMTNESNSQPPFKVSQRAYASDPSDIARLQREGFKQDSGSRGALGYGSDRFQRGMCAWYRLYVPWSNGGFWASTDSLAPIKFFSGIQDINKPSEFDGLIAFLPCRKDNDENKRN